MYLGKKIVVVIPAYNEEKNIGLVLNDIDKNITTQIIVANNNSTDNTAAVATKHGATVLLASTQGYGSACLTALNYIAINGGCDIVVFIDADYSDYPQQMDTLIQPILLHQAQLVIGSRFKGKREKGSMTLPQVFGNKLAVLLINIFFGVRYSDLGPFRAISWKALQQLNMEDKNYGWTVEMQVKAIKKGITFAEVAVDYKNRATGKSKISGTVKGTLLAGYKIIKIIFQYA